MFRYTVESPCDDVKKSTGSQIGEIKSIPRKPPKGRKPTLSPEERHPLKTIRRDEYKLSVNNCVHEECHDFIKMLKKDNDLKKLSLDWRIKSRKER